MNARDVIDSYVADVAVRLPRNQRNDVAFELRALLEEELHSRTEGAGQEPDAELATELVQAFGRPPEVAARYRPSLVIIDPADGYRFLRATIGGLAVIWCLGLIANLRHVAAADAAGGSRDLLTALGSWWGGTVIPSFWWPGVLVVAFGLTAWTNRRWPQTTPWRPRAADRIRGGRVAMVMGVLGILCGLYVLVDPRWLLDRVWGGLAAPAAYDALSYTEAFRQTLGPWLWGLILLDVPLYLAVVVKGRWSRNLRRLELVLSLVTCGLMLATVLGGPILMTSTSNRFAKFALVLITLLVVGDLGFQWLRLVRPAPSRERQSRA